MSDLLNWKPVIEFVDVWKIVIHAALNRWTGSPADLDMMHSIETQGMYQPPGVYPNPDGTYTLAWGSRRVEAWKHSPILRDRLIPVVMVEPARALRGTLDENGMRRQLSSLDKARYAKFALENSQEQALAQQEIALSLGVSEAWLSNVKKAAEHTALWERVAEKKFPVSSAIEIASLPQAEITAFLATLDRDHKKATRAEIRELVREWQGVGVTAKFSGTHLPPVAPELVRTLLAESPGTGNLDFSVEWATKNDTAAVVVRLPYSESMAGQARQVLEKARGMAAAPATAPVTTPVETPTEGPAEAVPPTVTEPAGPVAAAGEPAVIPETTTGEASAPPAEEPLPVAS